MSKRNLVLDKAPFIRKVDSKGYSTEDIMKDFVIALLPLILFAWVKNGLLPFINNDTKSIWDLLKPLIMVFIGGFTTYLIEFCYYRFIRHEKAIKQRMRTTFAVIPGLLLAMILPLGTPLWVLIFGCVFATVIGKILFGGFGNNIFNPALLGYLFVTTAFTALTVGKNLNPSEAFIAGATPMAELTTDYAGGAAILLAKYPLWKIFLGLTPGALAETSALLCLISLIYLLVRKVINWRIPVIYLATVFVLTYVIGAFNGNATDLKYTLVHMMSGALMFGAVFMATEPVTSPRTPNGKIVYALFLGVLTVLFRFRSNMPEGVATSILIMNLFTFIIDRVTARLRVEADKRRVVLNYAIIGILVLGIGAYGVSAAVPKTEEVAEIEVVYKSKTQDYDTLDFVYTIEVDGTEIEVVVDKAYKIKNVSDRVYNTSEYKDKISEAIKKQKFTDYVEAVNEEIDYMEVTVVARAQYAITAVIGYDENYEIVSYTTDLSNETYDDDQYYGGWDPADGDPAVLIPDRIVAAGDLDDVETITGATNTCNGMINAARVANAYRDYILTAPALKLLSAGQNYENLNFTFLFRQNGEKFVIETDHEYTIITELEDEVKTAAATLIAKSKLSGYIESVTVEGENTVITVKTKRPVAANYVTSTVTFAGGVITEFVADTADEDYDDAYNNWDETEGHPKDVIPGRIIEHQDDLDAVEPVTGATHTSDILVEAARIAMEYMEAQNE